MAGRERGGSLRELLDAEDVASLGEKAGAASAAGHGPQTGEAANADGSGPLRRSSLLSSTSATIVDQLEAQFHVSPAQLYSIMSETPRGSRCPPSPR